MKSRVNRFSGFVAILLSSFLLSQCSEEKLRKEIKEEKPNLTNEEISRLILLDTNYRVALSTARHEAELIGGKLDTEDAGKGITIKRTIGQVLQISIPDTIKFPKQVNRKNDPGFYIFNFSDDKGFVIVSGDERAMGSLGYSGTGTVNKSVHPGMTLFLSRAVEYIQFKRKTVEAMRGDAVHRSLLKKLASFEPPAPSHDKISPAARVAPPCIYMEGIEGCSSCAKMPVSNVISTTNSDVINIQPIIKTEWGQEAPFNELFPGGCDMEQQTYYGQNPFRSCTYSNTHLPAGCVPVSEAQVIANYFGRNAVSSDWVQIANTNRDNFCDLSAYQRNKIADLIAGVYDRYAIALPSCDGTFVFNHEIWFANGDKGISPLFGFVQGDWQDYNRNDLLASLSNGSPVPIQGAQHLWCLDFIFFEICTPDPTVMHQWIVDGSRTLTTETVYTVDYVDYDNCEYLPTATYTSTYSRTFVHNNWGWGGNSNGWFYEAAFGDFSMTNQWVYAYNHSDKIIAYVTPL